jgi:hypothetical protein
MSEETAGMEIRHLAVQHLDVEAFESYGVVLGPETADSPNFNRAPGNLGFLWIQRAMEFPKQPYLGWLRYYYRSMDGRNGVVLHPGTWVRYAFAVGPWVDFAYVTQRVDPATANSTDDTVRFQLHEEYGLVLDVEFATPDGAELGPGDSVVGLPPQNPPHE